MATEYKDFKYVLQDAGSLYLGAKYTYDELTACEDVPFKLKAVFERYIRPEVDGATTLESHFYYLGGSGFVYETYKQLKIKIKAGVLTEKKPFLGKARRQYETQTFRLEQLVRIPPEEKERQGMIIQEIGMSKIALMTFSV